VANTRGSKRGLRPAGPLGGLPIYDHEQHEPKVDAILRKEEKWREAFEQLRAIALECPLTEELKWGCPCYTYQGSNVGFDPRVQRPTVRCSSSKARC